jgi:hypothetical protein
MTPTLEIPFPPGHRERYAGRLELPFVPVEPRWEYRELVREAPDLVSEAELNALGAEGWELSGVAPAGRYVHFYLKRERRV